MKKEALTLLEAFEDQRMNSDETFNTYEQLKELSIKMKEQGYKIHYGLDGDVYKVTRL